MPNSLQAIEPCIARIEQLAIKVGRERNFDAAYMGEVEAALNGHLSKTLRSSVPAETLQRYGAFFTDEAMSNRLVSSLDENPTTWGSVLDAACGGGNLLLAYARKMPLQNTWLQTLRFWGVRLKGFDIHEPFVRATRARLALFALQKGVQQFGAGFINADLPPLEQLFPDIQKANSFEVSWPQSEIVLLNPPFTVVPVPGECHWATGRVSQAPLFLERCLRQAQPGTKVRAILPDVLRSGSRYHRWRLEIGQLSIWQGVEILGRFDQETGVDVFLLKLDIQQPETPFIGNWWAAPTGLAARSKGKTVTDMFEIKVGCVVPHRDEEQLHLNEYSYISPREALAWQTIEPGEAKRRYNGTTFRPPFVLIRRTSRSQDKHRAVGTIVKTCGGQSEEVAVENHLMVATPHFGSLQDCEALLEVLRDARTSEWLNHRIRCRHLTVGAMSDLPWWPS